MSISLLVAGLGCLGAAAGTGMLVARCLRAPNGALVAWTAAMFGLAISLAAQTVGHAIGFGPVAFRGMEIGAGIIASLALAIGLTEVAGRKIPARFAVRLVLPAIAFVSLVILGSDPLSVTPFSKAWPDPVLHYQIIPNQLLKYLLPPVTALVALIALGFTAVRSQRERAWRDAVPPVAAATAAALALSVPGLTVLAGGNVTASLHVGALFALLCVAAMALTWFASARISRVRLRLLRQAAGGPAETDEWALQHSWAGGPDGSGEFEPLGGDGDPYGSLYRHHDDHPDYGAAAYAGLDAEPGGYAANGAYHGPEPGYDDTGYREAGREADPLSGAWRGDDAGDGRPVPGRFGYQGSAADDDGSAGARLFGQIAIYTLLEDRVADFDRLTKHVVKQVRANEPDTLVFIVHAVPSAPMQRILYEVYRDRSAYEEHKRQPYVAGFESDRRPYVLATNVIELGLQQAKVSPLPSISDLLSDTGYDLLNDTGLGQPGFGPRSAGRPGAGSDRAGGGVAGGGVAGGGVAGGGPDGGGTAGGPPGAHRPR